MGDRDEAVKAAMAGIVCYLNLRPEARDGGLAGQLRVDALDWALTAASSGPR